MVDSTIVKDPKTQKVPFLTSLILLVIGALLTQAGNMFYQKITQERRALGYTVLANYSLVDVKPEAVGKIKVYYNENPTENLYLFKVRIVNIGNMPLKNQAVLFAFDESAEVLSADYRTVPEKEFGRVDSVATKRNGERKYLIELLNPADKREEIEFTFLTRDNKSDSIGVYAKGENLVVEKLEAAKGEERARKPLGFEPWQLYSLVLLFFVATIMSAMEAYRRARYKARIKENEQQRYQQLLRNLERFGPLDK